MTLSNSSANINLETLRHFGVNYLFHMTSIDNLENIMAHGLYSHNLSRQQQLLKCDISNQDVNQRRAGIYDPHYNHSLHDYVPFFINPRNAMLYALRAMQCNLAILAVSIKALESRSFLFTDGNAANYATSMYNNLAHLSDLNWNAIRAKYWNDYHDGRRIVNAEFLIPEKVDVKHIAGVILYHSTVENRVKSVLHVPESVSLKTYPQYFF